MTEASSYLRYLPPILGESAKPINGHEESTRFVLGRYLMAFEKMLTGLPTDGSLPNGNQHISDRQSIADVISRLPSLFDAWQTPEDFLGWLASWVALEFPTLQNKPVWDEYQQRKAVSEIAAIHRLRGLKRGLNTALNLFAVTTARPRVAVDDGNKLLVLSPRPSGVAPVTALISQGPTLTHPISSSSTVTVNGLVRPRCLASGADGSLFVGDFGAATTVTALPARVWRLSAAGALDSAGTPPVPRPLAPGTQFTNIVALAVRPAGPGQPESLLILDGNRKLLALDSPYDADTATPLTAALPTVRPVAMAVDTNGDVLILDRGNTVGDPAIAKVVVVHSAAGAAPQVRPLVTVVEPLSLLIRVDGALIIGDGQDQSGRAGGNLVVVDRSNPSNWTESAMLPNASLDGTAGGTLVSPSSLTAAPDGRIFVLDTGLRPFATGDTILTIARPAAIFELSDNGAVALRPVAEHGNLVFPTGMVWRGDRLVICDPGQLESAQQAPVLTRLSPFRFCVAVHFEEANLPSNEAERLRLVRQVDASIRSVVEQLRPAHTLPTVIIAG